MENEKVVVSTIGNFVRNYEEVTYCLADSFGEQKVKTKFSSIALAKMSGAKSIVVFAPISLAAEFIPSSEGVSLKEMSDIVETKSMEFLRGESGNDMKIKVVVTPTKGTFPIRNSGNGTIEIKSGSGNFYVAVYQSVMEIFKGSNGCEVLVDITHSVNYMALDMVEATNLALRSLNASGSTQHGFNFKVYNSDPFVRGSHSPLQLNLIRTEPIVDRSLSLSRIVGDLFYNFDGNYCKRALKKASLDTKVKIEILRKLAYSFLLGAVLFVASYEADIIDWAGDVWNSMDSTHRTFISNQQPAMHDGVLDFGIELERELPKIHAFLSSISSREFSKLDSNPEIEKLKIAADMLVEPGRTLLKNELHNLKKDIVGLTEDQRTKKVLLRKILKHKYSEEETDKECKLDRRNFIAHAGLEANVSW
ncbi:MAG: CRISPR-associated CARF protein Csx1, partial [Thermoplasmatales archaeon]